VIVVRVAVVLQGLFFCKVHCCSVF
jgi:hypothetical protein